MSRSSLDSTSTSVTISLSSNSNSNTMNYTNIFGNWDWCAIDEADPGVGGVPNRFFGITDMAEYQMSLFHAIESRLKAKCDKLADVCILDEFDVSSTGNPNTSARLPERVKLIIEDIEREETALQEDLYSVNRKFVEYYNWHKEEFYPYLVQLFLPQPSPSCTYNFGNGVSFGDGFVEAREEMSRERLRYLEAMVYEALEHKLVVAEANQRLRLPLIAKDNEIQEEEIEKCSIIAIDEADPGVGGVPNRFFGITVVYLRKTQLQHAPLSTDMAEYQMSLFHAIESRLKAKCDKLADVCILDEFDVSSTGNPNTSARLPERVKLIIEDIEREETALQEDLYSVNRKFVEYYNWHKEEFYPYPVQLFLPQPSPSCTYNFGNGVSFGDGFVKSKLRTSSVLLLCGGVDLGYCGRCRFQVGVTMDSGKDEEMRRTIRA
ncbi:unnamed protein product [Ilex paraguariensis]|uniref:Uncharacterized protein n=1 Tax=Ilex paraguariensis TaxID=185542 RepID=A0ABC8RME2_9AQUA